MIVGVTGHRDVEQEPGELLAFARLSVALMVERGCLEIITGMARGWDLKVARAAVDAGVPFTAAIPFFDQGAHWGEDDRLDYSRLLPRAKDLWVAGKAPLNRYYHVRDRWIVDRCDELWALDSGRPSGSHTTVLYADRAHRIVRPLWEPWLRFRAERN